jgi:hypothetical protein
MSSSKTVLAEIVPAGKNYRPSRAYTIVVDNATQIGFEVKKVDTLPEVGETKYLYLVPKEGSGDDTCDEYVWAIQEDGTYGWELVGSTAVQVILYDELGENTDGAMTQKAVTDAIGDIEAILHEINNGSPCCGLFPRG